MSNYETSADLLKGALRMAGEVTDGASPYHSIALEYLNLVYTKILAGSPEFNVDFGEPYVWMRATNHLSVILKALYNGTTASLTNGSTSGTFASAPAISLAGYVIKFDDNDDYYVIRTHTAGQTGFTLDGEYTGDTESGISFEAYRLTYDIGINDILRLVEPMRVYRRNANGDEYKIYGLDVENFRRKFPLTSLSKGVPEYFTKEVQKEGVFKITFNKYVSEDTKVDFDYVPKPTALTDSSGSIPIIPLEHRISLSYLSAWLLLLDKKDTSAAKEMLVLGQASLNSMVAKENMVRKKTGRSFAKVIPRRDLC